MGTVELPERTMKTEGWAPLNHPAASGKLHFFDKTGKSLCNRWPYLGQEMVDKTPQWQDFAEDEEDWKNILDQDFCQDCQLKYEGGGRRKPGSPLPKCDTCGRFCIGSAREVWNWYTESVDVELRCKECER